MSQLAEHSSGRVAVRLPAPPTAEAQRWDRAPFIVGSLIALAGLLRIPNLTRGYWVDEGISIGIAGHPLRELPHLLRLDGSPPAFYVLLHFWLRAFGSSEVSTHTLSMLTSLAVIPVAFWCGRTLFGRTAGLWAAVLAATNPFLAWYATETRMYPLVCALAMLLVTLAVKASRDRRAVDVAWAVILAASLLYLHNWGFYVVGMTGAVLLGDAVRRGDRTQAWWTVAAGLAVGVAYLPWLPTFLFQAHNTAAPWAVRPNIGDFWADPSSALGGTLGLVIEPLLGVPILLWWWRRPRSVNRPVGMIVLIAVLTISAGWLAAQVEPSWASRYLAVALGPLLLVAAGALAGTAAGRRLLLSAAAVLVAWSIVGSLLSDPNATYAKSNVEAIAIAARPYLSPGDVVLVTQTEQLAVVAHYLPTNLQFLTPTGPVDDPTVVDWRNLVPRLQRVDPCATIAPIIDALPADAHVLVINPFRHVGASGSLWSRTVDADVVRINQLLLSDPTMSQGRSFMDATRPKPFSAVTGLLFTKTAGASHSCSPAGVTQPG